MKVKWEMIDKELRTAGLIMQIIPKLVFNRRGFRLLNKIPRRKLKKPKRDTVEFYEKWIPRKNGSQLRVCVFKPKKANDNLPGLLWLHGGGYAIGTPEQSEMTVKRLIETCDCIIVAPDYRLSVETPYPAALEDSYQTLLWMKSNAKELGIRDNQLMVGGESAGGGLTAALTLYARDKEEVAIAFQMPLYPMLDDRMSTLSARDNKAPVWNSKSNAICWKLYLGELHGTEDVPCYAAPSRAIDFRNLPPMSTFVGDLEPFRDEVIQYVDSLRKAGVKVDFKVFEGCYHAFEQVYPKAEISKKAIAFMKSTFKFAVENYFAEQGNRYSGDS